MKLYWKNLDWQKGLASIILGIFFGFLLTFLVIILPEFLKIYGVFIFYVTCIVVLTWAVNKFFE